MKDKLPFFITVIFIIVYIFSCASDRGLQWHTEQRQSYSSVETPRQFEQRQSNTSNVIIHSPVTAPSSMYWNGDGGKGIQLAVLEPVSKGLSINENWIPSLIQSSITGDFQKYSAMTIIDRQNLEKILSEQKQSLSGNYSDDDYIRIGKLTNARYILAGSITKTASAFLLEFAVTDAESGERKASYPPKAVSLFVLEDLSAIKEATAELLKQLGVQLTSAGLQALNNTANIAQVKAETALAKGIEAQKQGTVVEALSYFIQANNYNTGLAEAASRMNILTANISSGNIGQDTRNDIAWRRQWVARLQETETFFSNSIKEPQPFYIVYSTDIKQGKIDYQKEVTDLSIWIGFYPDFIWAEKINEVINAVKKGLQTTGRAQVWELDWPVKSISTPSPFINQTKNSTSTVVVEIINSEGKSIGRQTVRSPYGFESKATVITPLWQWEGNVAFPSVDANLITDKLTIRIASIDGISAENAAKQKNISIMPLAEWESILKMLPSTRQNIERVRQRQRAEDSRKYADEQLKNGYNDSAIASYTETIRLNPNDAMAYNGRGNAYFKNKNYDLAITDWVNALRLDSDLTEARRNIESTRQQQQREKEQQQQREREQQQREQQQRERELEQQQREQTQRAQAFFEQGKKNRDIRDYRQAIADFTEAIMINPNFNHAWFYRAWTYHAMQSYDNALADYTQYIKLNPNDPAVYNNRGSVYSNKNDYDMAIADYTQAIRLNTNNALYYENRGDAYLGKKYYSMAITDYTEAIRLDPKRAKSYNNRGVCYENTGEKIRAIADFETALKLDPNSTLYRNNFHRVRGW